MGAIAAKKGRGGVRGGPPEAAQKLASTQRGMRASEGSFMGSDSAGRPSERPRQGERKPLPRADSCLTSAAERASTAPQMAHATDRLSSAQLGLGSQNEPFQGGTGRLLEFALQGPRISKFRRRNPLELETPKTAGVRRASHGTPSELPRKLGADRAPGSQVGFWANQP